MAVIVCFLFSSSHFSFSEVSLSLLLSGRNLRREIGAGVATGCSAHGGGVWMISSKLIQVQVT